MIFNLLLNDRSNFILFGFPVSNNCGTGGTNNCATTGSTCTYTGPGTYTCACNTGYNGTGTVCTGFPSFLFSFPFLSFLSTFIAKRSTIARVGARITAQREFRLALQLVLGHSLVLAFQGILGMESLAQVGLLLPLLSFECELIKCLVPFVSNQ